MNNARNDHTASVLRNGQVLVTGGSNYSLYLNSTELYDPSIGTWTMTGNMNYSRAVHTASVLSDGKVLVTGGYDGSSYLNSAELYDPSTGFWTTTGIVGGWDGSSFLNSAELYDPSTGLWTTTGGMNSARNVHTTSVLTNGDVLATGGFIYFPLSTSELY
ncbi:unnamed protein product [Rotaria sp. Silwood1]|nr:unnamed protein product [Rotaria sp. Silwood1]